MSSSRRVKYRVYTLDNGDDTSYRCATYVANTYRAANPTKSSSLDNFSPTYESFEEVAPRTPCTTEFHKGERISRFKREFPALDFHTTINSTSFLVHQHRKNLGKSSVRA